MFIETNQSFKLGVKTLTSSLHTESVCWSQTFWCVTKKKKKTVWKTSNLSLQVDAHGAVSSGAI